MKVEKEAEEEDKATRSITNKTEEDLVGEIFRREEESPFNMKVLNNETVYLKVDRFVK